MLHILQPKHTKLSEKEAEVILKKLNVSKAQLPKILSTDSALPKECNIGEMIKIERKSGENIAVYYRIIV